MAKIMTQEAADRAIAPWLTEKKVERLAPSGGFKVHGEKVSLAAYSLYKHILTGRGNERAAPAAQTNEELTEAVGYEVEPLITELVEKGLLEVEERSEGRYLSTDTAKAAGL